jgi:hypothetical protein
MRASTAVLVGLQTLGLAAANPLPPKRATQDATMTLQDGSVRGFTDSFGNSVFLGIPFAESTGGQNRYVYNDGHM